jgi:hypothetical protein
MTPAFDLSPTQVLGTREHEGNRLACPTCGDTTGTHVDSVLIAARQDDGPFNNIVVDAISGAVQTQVEVEPPSGETVGQGRRHRIVLVVECEHCAGKRHNLVFTQHKGVTFVEWAPLPETAT